MGAGVRMGGYGRPGHSSTTGWDQQMVGHEPTIKNNDQIVGQGPAIKKHIVYVRGLPYDCGQRDIIEVRSK